MLTFSVAFLNLFDRVSTPWIGLWLVGWLSRLNSCQQPLGEASTACCMLRKGFYTRQQHVISGFYYMFILWAQQPLGGLIMSLDENRPALLHRLLAPGSREGPPGRHWPRGKPGGHDWGREMLGKHTGGLWGHFVYEFTPLKQLIAENYTKSCTWSNPKLKIAQYPLSINTVSVSGWIYAT